MPGPTSSRISSACRNGDRPAGFGAVEKTRTSTEFPPQRPQRCASTSSATTARQRGRVISKDAIPYQARWRLEIRMREAGIEWRHSDRPVGYDAAVAAMERRIAAIRDEGAPELVWLLE